MNITDFENEFCSYLKDCIQKIKNGRKSSRTVIHEIYNYFPSLVSELPIEIKSKIIGIWLSKKSEYKTLLRLSKNFDSLVAFCGRDYIEVIKFLFKNVHPSELYENHISRLRTIKFGAEALNKKNIMVYANHHTKKCRKWVCYISEPVYFDYKTIVYDFEQYKKITFHESITLLSTFGNGNNYIPFEHFFYEGVHLDGRFRPIHIVDKNPLMEINF